MDCEKIGIMGGTFNPIHIGHLILAEQALDQYELDKILFMPSKKPPHKVNQPIESDYHRLELVKLAIENHPRFSISTMELEREGMTYTVDTLKILTKQYPNKKFFFIVGGDSIFQLETWYKPEEIMKMTHILAASRYGITEKRMIDQIQYLTETYHGSIELLKIPIIDISSNMIRTSISQGKSVRYYLPYSVLEYIINHGLYQMK